MLSDVYLATCDPHLDTKLQEMGILKALRYVDDYLIFGISEDGFGVPRIRGIFADAL